MTEQERPDNADTWDWGADYEQMREELNRG